MFNLFQKQQKLVIHRSKSIHMQRLLMYKLQLLSDAVLAYSLYPENNCKPVQNAYVRIFQVNYLCKNPSVGWHWWSSWFSNISLSYTLISQNASVQKEKSSRVFQQNAFPLENEIQSPKVLHGNEFILVKLLLGEVSVFQDKVSGLDETSFQNIK